MATTPRLTRRRALFTLAGGTLAAGMGWAYRRLRHRFERGAAASEADTSLASASGPRRSPASPPRPGAAPPSAPNTTMPHDPVIDSAPLDFQWPTRDPFLFCVHHDDHYPAGTSAFGPPAAALSGRNIGSDFELRDGFRMYHGDVVPGFPRHPHRGFETVTIVRRGLLDHADSMGAVARYGGGDVQWLTAGDGIQHAEMFPLLRPDADNPLELFQIWLNLPARNKRVAPHFSMLWSERIPVQTVDDGDGRSEVTVIAGRFGDGVAPPPPPDSWASQEGADVAIWTLRLDPGARLTLPPASAGVHRTLYAFAGAGFRLGGAARPSGTCYALQPQAPTTLDNGAAQSEMLLLQGRPIGEPVARHGPFVMNTRAELQQAYDDYRRTEFGGWPWARPDPVHGSELQRFAVHADGRRETPA